MNSKSFLALLVVGSLLTVLAADPPKSAVVHIPREKVDASFAANSQLLATNNFKIITARRTGPGEVEIHDEDTDIFYVLEGSATFITGGKVVAPKASGPGETRAKEILGGEERHLMKGDILIIPNRVPHWFKEVNGPFLYYIVKVKQ